jgi:hypothetical protein
MARRDPPSGVQEVTRAVREALGSWSRTARLSALITVAAVDWALVQWLLDH